MGGLLARAFSGRRLILFLGVALIGLVFLQVTLLQINTATSADAEKAQVLRRDNAAKRALIAQMGAGRRVEDAAGSLGMVMPASTEVCYLRIGRKANCPDVLSAAEGQGVAGDGASGTAADGGGDGAAPDSQDSGQESPPADGPGEAAPAPEPPQAPAQGAPEPGPTVDSGGLQAGGGD